MAALVCLLADATNPAFQKSKGFKAITADGDASDLVRVNECRVTRVTDEEKDLALATGGSDTPPPSEEESKSAVLKLGFPAFESDFSVRVLFLRVRSLVKQLVVTRESRLSSMTGRGDANAAPTGETAAPAPAAA